MKYINKTNNAEKSIWKFTKTESDEMNLKQHLNIENIFIHFRYLLY